MEINAEDLSKFLYEKIKHHEELLKVYVNNEDEYYREDKYAEGYHKGSINAYQKIINEFNLQRLF